MSLAYTTNQLQEYSGGPGRAGDGLAGATAHREAVQLRRGRIPAARMREYVLALRAIWASWNEGATLRASRASSTRTP